MYNLEQLSDEIIDVRIVLENLLPKIKGNECFPDGDQDFCVRSLRCAMMELELIYASISDLIAEYDG